jgi:hypothetical protein
MTNMMSWKDRSKLRKSNLRRFKKPSNRLRKKLNKLKPETINLTVRSDNVNKWLDKSKFRLMKPKIRFKLERLI